MGGNNILTAFENAARSGYMSSESSSTTRNRPPIIWGTGVPNDTTDLGMMYIDMNGATGDLVLYTWDDTASQWDAMTA